MSLLDDLRAEGLNVATWPNWETHAAPMPSYVDGFHPIGVLVHWDAVRGFNPRTYFDNPRFNQPTYHVAHEIDGTVWLGSQGYVYGAGGGDSQVYEAMRRNQTPPKARIAKDMNGNPWFWAVCLNYYPDGSPIPAAQYESLVRSVAAICRREGWNPLYRVDDHDGWTTRKDDLSGNGPLNAHPAPANWSLDRFRLDVAHRLEDDMITATGRAIRAAKKGYNAWQAQVGEADGLGRQVSVTGEHADDYGPAMEDLIREFQIWSGIPASGQLDYFTLWYLGRWEESERDASLWVRVKAHVASVAASVKAWTKTHVKAAIAAAIAGLPIGDALDINEVVDQVIAELTRLLGG